MQGHLSSGGSQSQYARIFIMKITIQKLTDFLMTEFQKEGAYLFPLRVFIGIGWIRASLEKVLMAGWYDGSALREFFHTQLADGAVRFPFYASLLQGVFAEYALILGWIIMVGQLLVGLSILTGSLTNFGLLWGLFMNINFILAGSVNPSTFYVVIQVALLFTHAGAILGGDSFFARFTHNGLFVAQAERGARVPRAGRVAIMGLTLLLFASALFLVPFIEDFSPHSVEDPAMILFILASLGSLSTLINYLRLQKHKFVPKPL